MKPSTYLHVLMLWRHGNFT